MMKTPKLPFNYKKIAPKLRGYISRDQSTILILRSTRLIKDMKGISRQAFNTLLDNLLNIYNIIIKFLQESENCKKNETPVLQFDHNGVILIKKLKQLRLVYAIS